VEVNGFGKCVIAGRGFRPLLSKIVILIFSTRLISPTRLDCFDLGEIDRVENWEMKFLCCFGVLQSHF
jgi:hypothetical protein